MCSIAGKGCGQPDEEPVTRENPCMTSRSRQQTSIHGMQAAERFGNSLAGLTVFDQDSVADELADDNVTAPLIIQALPNLPSHVLPATLESQRGWLKESGGSAVVSANRARRKLALNEAASNEPSPFPNHVSSASSLGRAHRGCSRAGPPRDGPPAAHLTGQHR